MDVEVLQDMARVIAMGVPTSEGPRYTAAIPSVAQLARKIAAARVAAALSDDVLGSLGSVSGLGAENAYVIIRLSDDDFAQDIVNVDHQPRRLHSSLEIARDEAVRLADKTPGARYVVFQAVGSAAQPKQAATWSGL